MKQLVVLASLVLVLVLGACGKEEVKKVDKKQQTTETSTKSNSGKLKLKADEVAVYHQDGSVETVKTQTETDKDFGYSFKVPTGLDLYQKENDKTIIHVKDTNVGAEIEIDDRPDITKLAFKNKMFVKMNSNDYESYKNFKIINLNTLKNPVKKDLGYLFKFKPNNDKYQVSYTGTIAIGEKVYNILVPNEKSKEEVLGKTLAMLQTLKETN